MAIKWSTKEEIDKIIPLLGSAYVAYYLYKEKENDVKKVALYSLVAYATLYFLTSYITESAYKKSEPPVPTGGGCDTYSPNSLAKQLKEDIDCSLCLRDRSLYQELISLSDCQLITLYNHWNKEYSDDFGSLPIAIKGEGNYWDKQFKTQQEAIADRFSRLGLR